MRSSLSSPALATLALGCAASLGGCFTPFEGLDGQWTRGELGNTRWQIEDGLCPGLGGGCSLDVPIATGAHTRLVIDGVDGVELTASITGSIEQNGTITTGEATDAEIPITASTAGTGRAEIADTNGVIDRASVTVRTPTRLECGRWDVDRALLWQMTELTTSAAIAVPVTVGSERTVELACRASDASGPILSADTIRWERLDGMDVLALENTGLVPGPGDVARGARIRYRSLGTGVANVRVTLGDLTEDLTITVE